MLTQTEIQELIVKQGILPLYFNEDAATSIEVLNALYAAGIRVIEYTNRGDNALANFKQLKDACAENYKDMCLGIGTIKSGAAAGSFIEAGADFLVSPCWNGDILTVCNEHNYLWIPGCMTPTEISQAEEKGLTLVKLFPGNLLGPSFVAAVREVFPAMQFMATGGVSLERQNLEEWFKAGVAAVGMGSKLISRSLLASRDFDSITNLSGQALATISDIRAALQ